MTQRAGEKVLRPYVRAYRDGEGDKLTHRENELGSQKQW